MSRIIQKEMFIKTYISIEVVHFHLIFISLEKKWPVTYNFLEIKDGTVPLLSVN